MIAKACTRPEPTAEGARRERWTYEELGEAVGMSGSQAHVILARAAIKPHLTEYWVMSDFSRQEFEERMGEICGLYVDPPENVLVVSIDEKTGIQAKAPTKPDAPPAPGQAGAARARVQAQRHAVPVRLPERPGGRRAGDAVEDPQPVRPDPLPGPARRRRSRWSRASRSSRSPTTSPPAAPRKSSSGSTAHPRWRFQFTPTHASWLNQIEIFFSILWRRLLKHGIFTSEQDLAEQMLAFVETYNQTAKPFKWTYTGKVLEA